MKEKITEFEVTATFNFVNNLTIEATSEQEAYKIAQKTLVALCKDCLSDKNNLNITIHQSHVITPEERVKLEEDHIIEPLKKTPKASKKSPKAIGSAEPKLSYYMRKKLEKMNANK